MAAGWVMLMLCFSPFPIELIIKRIKGLNSRIECQRIHEEARIECTALNGEFNRAIYTGTYSTSSHASSKLSLMRYSRGLLVEEARRLNCIYCVLLTRR